MTPNDSRVRIPWIRVGRLIAKLTQSASDGLTYQEAEELSIELSKIISIITKQIYS